jgi:uncharacterized protein
MPSHAQLIARTLQIAPAQVETVAALLDDGATIPFIARYRKEATGSLDEVQLTAIRDQRGQLIELDRRRTTILSSLAERDLLGDDLRAAIDAAPNLSALEDIYLPYRPKRRTRAQKAKERGLEPLAQAIYAQEKKTIDPASFINPELEVGSEEEALDGARDIIAEWVSEDAALRARLRTFFLGNVPI